MSGERSTLAEVLAEHTPVASIHGSLYCFQCTMAAEEWVTWSREHVAEALGARS